MSSCTTLGSLMKGKSREGNGTSGMITIFFNLLVLMYVMKLENKMCGCVSDWRHDFIKYYSMAIIGLGVIMLFVGDKYNNNMFLRLFKVLLMVASLINFWCLYTYVGDLDTTKCVCAVEKQKDLHYFLYIFRYVMLISLILAIINSILLAITC